MTASVRGQLGIAALITVAGTAGAAENLPPLRIDPSLLGAGTPVAKQKEQAAARAAAEPAAVISAPPVAPLVQTAPVPAAVSAPSEPALEKPQTAKAKAAKPAKPAPEVAAASIPEAQVRPLPLPTPVKERPVEAPRPREPEPAAVVQTYDPPKVTEQPRVPPLYSAQARAGLVPGKPGANSPDWDKVFVTADRVEGRTEDEVVATGSVELKKRDVTMTADRLTYWQAEGEAEAEGNVRIVRDSDVISGPKARMRLDESQGYFEQPDFLIRQEIKEKKKNQQNTISAFAGLMPQATPVPRVTTGTGHADRIDFEGEGHYSLKNATYTTCQAPAGEQPDWYAQLASLNLDYDREVGSGTESKLVFKGVPILYSPWMSFSLNNQRKSGILPPTFGTNTRTGLQYSQPAYWNIAPNMDATFTPRLMARRGMQYSGEVRYLDYNYAGQSRFEYLPDDRVTHTSRSAYSIVHTQNFGQGFTGNINLNGVSDDNYFVDLSTRLSVVSQGNLVRQGNLAYAGSWWSANLLAQRYQTLQDPTAPVVPPYARLPQFSVTGLRPDLPFGANFSFAGEYVNFSHPTLPLGKRTVFYPQLSLPLQSAAFYVTPKVGLHTTSYELERQGVGIDAKQSRQLPIISVDSGASLERDTQMFGRNVTQTLEPRLYYVYIPNKDQSNIPVFDSALADFNFAQIFSENRYGGSDRIGDANQLTAAVTSRLIDPDTGVEMVRGMLGQRYYFSTQKVTLPGETPRVGRDADFLASLSGLVLPKTYIDTGVQYNPRESRTERLNLSARYQPEIGKVLNAGYRYTRDLLGQIDVSAQWPLAAGWSGVGRYNFSTKEKRLVEGVAGFEYNGGCWAVRGVVQQIAITAQSKVTSFFIQLELTGFSNIGSNPAEILRRNIPGYGRDTQSVSDAVFGTN